ncbi:MAG TPA: hypothetical protein VK563_21300 [Puia sp.]|nr:hypothetical protein [Puia sp.]
MSHFEPEVRDFMRRIVLSLLLGLVWLVLNMTLGLYFGLLFIWGRPTVANLIFYIFMIVSLAFLIRFFVKTWRKRFPHG